VSPIPDRAAWKRLDPDKTIVDWENEMRKFLEQAEAGAFIYRLPSEVYMLMGQVLAKQPEGDHSTIPLSSVIVRKIFVRLMQDLRAAHLVASAGYATATGTIVSAIAEIAFEPAWIGTDSKRAHDWNEHEQRKTTLEGYKKRRAEVLELRHSEISERTEVLKFEEVVYESLCMLKHGNPVYQKGLSSFEANGATTFSPIPAPTSNALHALTFSMMHACRLCLQAAMDVIDLSRPGTAEEIQDLVDQTARLMVKIKTSEMATSLQNNNFEVMEFKAEIARAAISSPLNIRKSAE